MIGDLGVTDATELAELVASGEVTPTELLDAALAAVEARNPALNAVVLVRIKERWGEGRLWVRLISSTVVLVLIRSW